MRKVTYINLTIFDVGMIGLLIQMLGNFLSNLVNITWIGKTLVGKVVHIVVLQIHIVCKLKVIFFFFAKGFKKILLQQRRNFIVDCYRIFRNKNSFVSAFVSHPVNR